MKTSFIGFSWKFDFLLSTHIVSRSVIKQSGGQSFCYISRLISKFKEISINIFVHRIYEVVILVWDMLLFPRCDDNRKQFLIVFIHLDPISHFSLPLSQTIMRWSELRSSTESRISGACGDERKTRSHECLDTHEKYFEQRKFKEIFINDFQTACNARIVQDKVSDSVLWKLLSSQWKWKWVWGVRSKRSELKTMQIRHSNRTFVNIKRQT